MLKLNEERDGFPITSLREILILKRLRHKNIVSLLDVFMQEKNRTKEDSKLADSNFKHGNDAS